MRIENSYLARIAWSDRSEPTIRLAVSVVPAVVYAVDAISDKRASRPLFKVPPASPPSDQTDVYRRTRSAHLRGIPCEGASRLIQLCGGAGYERVQQPSGSVSTPSLTPFAALARSRACVYVYIYIYGLSRRSHSRSRLLPLQSARLLRLANYRPRSIAPLARSLALFSPLPRAARPPL